MNPSARATLQLRAFYRLLKRRGGNALDSYYKFCNGETEVPHDASNIDAWCEAADEARMIELGTDQGNEELDTQINAHDLGPAFRR